MPKRHVLFLLCFFCAFSVLAESFDWSGVEEVWPGVKIARMKREEPRLMEIRAARIDLRTPGLAFRVTGRAENWGEPMEDAPKWKIRTERKSTRQFMQQHPELVLAVNSAPWSPWKAPWTHRYADNLGLLISEGILVSPLNRNPSFVIAKDGTVSIRQLTASDPLDGIWFAVSGFGIMLKEGKVQNSGNNLAPRTGYGVSRDGRYLYWITIDGRQAGYSMGATTSEVGAFLLYFGSWTGINMDGGGSTTLILREVGSGNLLRLNHAVGERKVGCNLGIYYRKK